MLARPGLDAQQALVCTMVLVAAADGGMTDREIGVMAGQVQTLPVFHNFSSAQLEFATDTAVSLLNEEDGLNHAGRLIRDALEPRLRETLRPRLRGGGGGRRIAPAVAANARIRPERAPSRPAGGGRDRARGARPPSAGLSGLPRASSPVLSAQCRRRAGSPSPACRTRSTTAIEQSARCRPPLRAPPAGRRCPIPSCGRSADRGRPRPPPAGRISAPSRYA